MEVRMRWKYANRYEAQADDSPRGESKGEAGASRGKLLCNCRFSQAAPDWLRMLLCVVVVLTGDKCNKNPKATRIIPIVSYHGTHRGDGGVEESYTGQWAGVFRCCLINDGHCGTEWWAASALTVLHGLARPGSARPGQSLPPTLDYVFVSSGPLSCSWMPLYYSAGRTN